MTLLLCVVPSCGNPSAEHTRGCGGLSGSRLTLDDRLRSGPMAALTVKHWHMVERWDRCLCSCCLGAGHVVQPLSMAVSMAVIDPRHSHLVETHVVTLVSVRAMAQGTSGLCSLHASMQKVLKRGYTSSLSFVFHSHQVHIQSHLHRCLSRSRSSPISPTLTKNLEIFLWS